MMPDLIKRFRREKPTFEDVLLLLLEQAQKGGENAVKTTLKILVKHKLIDLDKFIRELENLVEKLTLMGELTPINDYEYESKISAKEEEQIELASKFIAHMGQEIGMLKREEICKLKNIDTDRLVRKTVKAKEPKQEQEQELDNVIPFPGPGM